MAKRELSCFVTQELLYEYNEKVLDERRSQAVQRHLKSCDKCESAFESVVAAKGYFNQLSNLQVSTVYVEQLQIAAQPLTKKMKKWNWLHWPVQVRWAVATVLLMVTAGIVVRVFRNEIPFLNSKSEVALINEQYPEGATGYPEEASSAEQILAESEGEAVDESVDGPDVPLKEVKATPVPKATASKAKTTTTATTTTAEAETAAEPKAAGFVYRMYMFYTDVKTLTPEITSKIEALGGERAGEVPLGWERPNGSYFHFTLSETGFEQLMQYLKEKAQVRLDKDTHPRVMPKGKVRAILWVEHKDATGVDSTESTEQSESTEKIERIEQVEQ